ncbi:MAG: double-strand break repair protein AddB [Hyphomicrobiales bacterium]|nr:double-strand break repair protein AddB [Hyphomicrobiales bacterium]
MSAPRPRIFSIPAGARFLSSFVDALDAGEIVPGLSSRAGPLAYADTTIYVPTRRAARALLSEFSARAGKGAVVLPKIRPLGAVDEDADIFAAPADDSFGLDPDVPEAIGDLRRRFILAELVLGWARALGGAIVRVRADGTLETDEAAPIAVGATPADAVALAGRLGALIDEFVIEGRDWTSVRNLVAEDYDRYWGITTQFLKIAIERWPDILADRGLVDGVTRRARLIEREIARVEGRSEPTIVLGSTGTNAATARLMAAIARAARGAVVLPGLDQDMRDIDWKIVAGADQAPPAWGHPQAALARLLRVLDAPREDVVALGARAPAVGARMRFMSHALAPEESTANWRPYREGRDAEIADALARVVFVDAPDETSEALAIAVRLREILETPGATAALITPDRAVARRVQAELRRWDIEIDDSGGEPLAQTEAGAFARGALTAVAQMTDVALVALLARSSVVLAADRARTTRLARLLETGVLRASPRDPDLAARIRFARRAAESDRHAHPAVRRIRLEDWDELEEFAARIASALAPLRSDERVRAVSAWARAHEECLRALAGGFEPASDDFAALAVLLGDLAAQGDADTGFTLSLEDYAGLFDLLAAGEVVRGPQRSHARIKILGPLEARLIDVDVAILAGLDETVWPPQPKSDPFLNRPMRQQIGLSPPERRIGQSAHDFWMGMGAPSVVITRARKRGGAPTVASRFLQRMAALAGDGFVAAQDRGKHLLALAAALDDAPPAKPLARPAPRPPLDRRPDSLSVTRIELLRRDPYAVYAERVLEVSPLGTLDGVADAADQGVALHAALRELATRWPTGELPADARDILLRAARENLVAFFADPTWAAFRWPRLVEGLDFVLAYERQRRPELAQVYGEVAGVCVLSLADGGAFRLSAEADRIERGHDGRLRIVDYKTGVAPSARQIRAGFASQLTLEAAMAAHGAFGSVGAHEAGSALYLKLGGKNGGKRTYVDDLTDRVAQHWSELQAMLDYWRIESHGYASRPYVQFASSRSDYDHLARVAEWSASGGEE